jgi:microcystin-dependent protein
MTETDAKTFIRAEVNKILWARVTWIAAAFGVVNIVTLIGLYFNLTSQAKKIAEEQVGKVALAKATELADKYKVVLDLTNSKVSEILSSYGDLRAKMGSVSGDLTSLEQKRAQTGQELDKLAAESTELKRHVETFKGTDTARVGELIRAIKDLPDGEAKSLINTLGAHLARIESLEDQIKVKADAKAIVARGSEGLIGTIQMFSGTLDTIPKGWRLCDGSSVSSNAYPKLYATIGQLWGRGDQAADENGSLKNFNLPDLRGQFVRGVDRGANRDPDAGVRKPLGAGSLNDPGTFQDHALSSHAHPFRLHGGASFDAPGEPHGAQGAGGSSPNARVSVDAAGGSETRPNNVSVFFIIAVD